MVSEASIHPSAAQALTRDGILQVALALIDRDGLETISIRRIADALGVGAMTLYSYVPGKTAILDGVFDRIIRELGIVEDHSTLELFLAEWARRLRSVLHSHPNALPLVATRPPLNAEYLPSFEPVLAQLERNGFSAREAMWTVEVLVAYVIGQTLAKSDPPVMVRRLNTGDFQRLDTRAFPRVLEAARVMSRREGERQFEFGLAALIAGLIARQAKGPPSRQPAARARKQRHSGDDG